MKADTALCRAIFLGIPFNFAILCYGNDYRLFREENGLQTKTGLMLRSSKLVEDYIQWQGGAPRFFNYSFRRGESYAQRLKAIARRDYKRSQLSEVLERFNRCYTDNKKVFENIKKLEKEETMVVVGGQQAGLLTGAALTVHKCLTIIKLAEEQERRLGKPVVPVFWIAGEDHDFDEINHLFVHENGHFEKCKYGGPLANKQSVSDLKLKRDELLKWVRQVFAAFGETAHTKDVLAEVEQFAEKSETAVDFFAFLLQRMFSRYGLILLDSNDRCLRQIERDYFRRMFDKRSAINQAVMAQLDRLRSLGYEVPLDQKSGSANLFINVNGGRELLEQRGEDLVGKNGRVFLNAGRFEKIVKETPEKLSNNVVTRPMMQELLLPTLAFIAGPGEITYWSALGTAFRCMGLDMPPVVPRLHLTFVPGSTRKWLEQKDMTIADILRGGSSERKERWLRNETGIDVDQAIAACEKKVADAHFPLSRLAVSISRGLENMADKNLQLLKRQVDILGKYMRREIERQYHVELSRFDKAETLLFPMGSPQERVWSIFYFINRCGFSFIDDLMNEDFRFDGGGHYLIEC